MQTVSVIMPCFNHSRFLCESVTSVLRQTYHNLELIIVDDCSSDDSWRLITSLAGNDPRIRPIRHERNQGVSRARNSGLRAARGEFIAFCDADDVWEFGKLTTQVALLDANPDYDVTYSDSRLIDDSGALTGSRFSDLFPPPASPSGILFLSLIKGNFINTQSVVMRRACATEKLFDQDLRVVEDWWYWIRLSRDHRFLYSAKLLGRYRTHAGGTCIARPRTYFVSRYKVHRRLLRLYPDLPGFAKAHLFFTMGADMCDIHKRRIGRRLLWTSIAHSMTDPRAGITACRAVRRLTFQAIGREAVDIPAGTAVTVNRTDNRVLAE
jgi:glycosyltransferase involved in cell wall biosynthesis